MPVGIKSSLTKSVPVKWNAFRGPDERLLEPLENPRAPLSQRPGLHGRKPLSVQPIAMQSGDRADLFFMHDGTLRATVCGRRQTSGSGTDDSIAWPPARVTSAG